MFLHVYWIWALYDEINYKESIVYILIVAARVYRWCIQLSCVPL